MRTMNRLVTAGAPASAPGEERAVIASANEDFSGLCLLLKMAFQTKILVSLREHLVVDRAVGIVAGRAAFANRFVFEHIRSTLGGVALRTRVGI